MCEFTTEGYVGNGSPDRANAAVWALMELPGGPAEWRKPPAKVMFSAPV